MPACSSDDSLDTTLAGMPRHRLRRVGGGRRRAGCRRRRTRTRLAPGRRCRGARREVGLLVEGGRHANVEDGQWASSSPRSRPRSREAALAQCDIVARTKVQRSRCPPRSTRSSTASRAEGERAVRGSSSQGARRRGDLDLLVPGDGADSRVAADLDESAFVAEDDEPGAVARAPSFVIARLTWVFAVRGER